VSVTKPAATRPAPAVQRDAAGDPILIPLDKLRPTQAVVGMRAVAAKREKVEDRAHKERKIIRFLEKRPIPAVAGPGGGYFIVDHHHLSLALWQSGVDRAFVRIIDDWSSLTRGMFWTSMARTGRVYPFDATGRRLRPHEMPESVHRLRADHYRDLAWSVREEGGYEKTWAPFAEFRWASFFRDHISLTSIRRDYDHALERALGLARSRSAASLPGYLGRY
jgi:hypothetical protein